MFRDKLFERNEEGGLDGYATTNLYHTKEGVSRGNQDVNQQAKRGDIPARRAAPKGAPNQMEGHNQGIWNQRDGDDEFGEFTGAPGALEVLAAVEERGAVQEDGEDILFDKGRGDQGPGVEDEARGDESEIGDDRGDGGFSGGGVHLTPSGDVVQQGKGEKADETGPSRGRDVDS